MIGILNDIITRLFGQRGIVMFKAKTPSGEIYNGKMNFESYFPITNDNIDLIKKEIRKTSLREKGISLANIEITKMIRY